MSTRKRVWALENPCEVIVLALWRIVVSGEKRRWRKFPRPEVGGLSWGGGFLVSRERGSLAQRLVVLIPVVVTSL